MDREAPIAFATSPNPAGIEIRVNFGVFAGREATPAELDDLAQTLLAEVGEVSVVAENRLEASEESEAALHLIRIEVPSERLAESETELPARLVQAAERWASACIDERHADVTEP